ncbi:10128_t:CDS:2, partial [Cetraspora pellucida]
YQHLHLAICEMFLKELLMPSCLECKDLIELESFCQLLKPFETATFVLSKDQFNSILEAITKSRPTINSIEYEIELYEQEPLKEYINKNDEKESNGILYWKSLSNRFPILSKMACNYLSIKPLSVSSERIFSRAGFTIINDRANLNEKTISCAILMHL